MYSLAARELNVVLYNCHTACHTKHNRGVGTFGYFGLIATLHKVLIKTYKASFYLKMLLERY